MTKIVIIGAGAMGSAFAVPCVDNNNEVILVGTHLEDDLIKKIKQEVKSKDKSIVAFNIGANIGKVSGQSIMHCHIHLIPRREGDVENPQGGVRAVIPKKQHYKRKF